MSRELCIVVRPVEGTLPPDVSAVEHALRVHTPPLNVQRKGDVLYVYYGRSHARLRASKAVDAVLHKAGVEGLVVRPLPVGRWVKARAAYVFENGTTVAELPPEQIAWGVKVRPSSAFVWRSVRDSLAARGRYTIKETDLSISVGARDELDARTLSNELATLPTIASAEPRRLSWIRRWLIRQAMLGNYSERGDPMSPPSA